MVAEQEAHSKGGGDLVRHLFPRNVSFATVMAQTHSPVHSDTSASSALPCTPYHVPSCATTFLCNPTCTCSLLQTSLVTARCDPQSIIEPRVQQLTDGPSLARASRAAEREQRAQRRLKDAGAQRVSHATVAASAREVFIPKHMQPPELGAERLAALNRLCYGESLVIPDDEIMATFDLLPDEEAADQMPWFVEPPPMYA